MRDRTDVAKVTETMKTVCVGRVLVDVPVQAKVSLSHEMIDGFSVTTLEESEDEFRDRVALREARIGVPGTGTKDSNTGGLVEARDLRVPGMVGRTLIFGKGRTHGFDERGRVDVEWVSVEAHTHMGSLSISLSMKYANEEKARVAEALLSRVQILKENEIPTVQGFCVDRAVFTEPLPSHHTEHIVMHIGLPNHPDLGMTLASLPGGGRSRGLLMRAAETDGEASPDEMLRVTKLRTGKRNINDLLGDEVLERVHELNFATTFGFMWETQGVKNDPLRPFLSFELQSGMGAEAGASPVDSSLHEDAVLALWDAISSSIRLRPSGRPLSDAPPPEPLGAQPVATDAPGGSVCHGADSAATCRVVAWPTATDGMKRHMAGQPK